MGANERYWLSSTLERKKPLVRIAALRVRFIVYDTWSHLIYTVQMMHPVYEFVSQGLFTTGWTEVFIFTLEKSSIR